MFCLRLDVIFESFFFLIMLSVCTFVCVSMLHYVDTYTQVMLFCKRTWANVVANVVLPPNQTCTTGSHPAPLTPTTDDDTVQMHVRVCNNIHSLQSTLGDIKTLDRSQKSQSHPASNVQTHPASSPTDVHFKTHDGPNACSCGS